MAKPATPGAPTAVAATGEPQLVILYMHGLRGQLKGWGGEGGYARLATIIQEQRQSLPAGSQLLVLADDAGGMGGAIACRRTRGKNCFKLLGDIGVNEAVMSEGESFASTKEFDELTATPQVIWLFKNGRTAGQPTNVTLARSLWKKSDKPSLSKKAYNVVFSRLGDAEWQTRKTELDAPALVLSGGAENAVEDAGAVLRVQVRSNGTQVARIVLAPASPSEYAKVVQHSFIDVNSSVSENAGVKTQIEALYQRWAPDADQVVGDVPKDVPNAELSVWLANAYRNVSRADLAIVPQNTVPGALIAGSVTREQLLQAAGAEDELMALDWSVKSVGEALCHASLKQNIVLSGATLVEPGTAQCRLQTTSSRREFKVVLPRKLVMASPETLGKDIRGTAFRMGYAGERAIDLYVKKNGLK